MHHISRNINSCILHLHASYACKQQIHTLCAVTVPDSEMFPVAIMGTSLKGKGGQPNGVGPIEGIEGQVIYFNCFHAGFLVEYLLDYHIQRHLL